MNEWMNREKEIREALEAGERAYLALTDAEKYLDSARGFGIWDLFGGGFLSSVLKHSKMDDAQSCMERAQLELQNFSRELKDVQGFESAQINFNGVTKFLDIFCDSFLVDLLVQSKISEAKKNVEQAKSSVRDAIYRLQHMLE